METYNYFHSVYPTLSTDLVEFKFYCVAPPGSPCRLACPHNCEKKCLHEMTDQGKCGWLDWMDTCPGEQIYSGDEVILHPGIVDFEWDGDMVTWKYDLDSPFQLSWRKTTK